MARYKFYIVLLYLPSQWWPSSCEPQTLQLSLEGRILQMTWLVATHQHTHTHTTQIHNTRLQEHSDTEDLHQSQTSQIQNPQPKSLSGFRNLMISKIQC